MAGKAGYKALVAKALASHSLLGIVLGMLVYHLCLTGSIAMLVPEWRRLEQPAAPHVPSATPEAFAVALDHGLALAGDPTATIMVFGPTDDLPRLHLRIAGKSDHWMDAAGQPAMDKETPWTDFLIDLHDRLYLPHPWGRLIVTLVGAALLAMIGTGIIAHSRIFRDAFHLRLGGSLRLESADLHNRMSVWGLPFHIAIAGTGAALAVMGLAIVPLASLAYDGNLRQAQMDIYGPSPNHADKRQAPLPDIAGMIRLVESRAAPAKVNFVLIQSSGTAGRMIEIGTDAPRDLAHGEAYYFGPDATIPVVGGFTSGPVSKQVQAALYPLHTGNFGGLPLRLTYLGLGLLLCWITATGMTIWFTRMRARGNAMPGRERLWRAFLWGQPVALALSLPVSMQQWTSPAPCYVAITLLTLVLGGCTRHKETVMRSHTP